MQAGAEAKQVEEAEKALAIEAVDEQLHEAMCAGDESRLREAIEGAKQTATAAGGGGGGAKARGGVVQSADPLRAMACDLEQIGSEWKKVVHDLRRCERSC